MINRRVFLRNASLLTLGGLLTGKAGRVMANPLASSIMAQPNASKVIGLQIYSLGKELYPDVAGGLKRVAQMGYSTIELAGYNSGGKINNVEMADFKKMADDAGLKILSSHLNPPVTEYTASTKQQISDFWKKAADDHA
jgi:hypothetical protein